MMYYKSNFDLSDKSKNYILRKFESKFSKNFEHDLNQDIIDFVPLFLELKQYLSSFNITFKKENVRVFTSNTRTFTKTNPHVDILHDKNNFHPIKSRFNILILGNPNDPMLWWDHFKFGDINHVKKSFVYNDYTHVSLGIPGDSIEERLKFLGTASCIKHDLLTPSSFVDTYCAHALELSPQPRLIVSVAIDKHLIEYCPNN